MRRWCWNGCAAAPTHKATLRLKGREPRVSFHCDDHVPGSDRPADATWPMCYEVELLPEPEQTIRLADTSGMLHRLASAEVAAHGRYLCMVDDKRTEVIA